MPNIAGDERALAAIKRLAQDKRISALCLEQYKKGLVVDYEAIRARVLQEDKVLPIDQSDKRKYDSTTVQNSELQYPAQVQNSELQYPAQLQSFGNQWPKEIERVGGQSYPSWAESKEKHMAHMNKVKPKLAGNSADNFTTPTWEELSDEQRQGYEVFRRKRKEEFEALKKKREDEDV